MTSIKIKKWKKICDPKTGKIILVPPSILSNDWWNNLQIDLIDSFRKLLILNWNGKILLWWRRPWVREEQKKYKEDIFRRRVETFHRNDPDFKTPRLKKFQKGKKSRKKICGGNTDSTENEHVTRETLDKDIDKILEADHEILFLPNIGIKLKIKK